MKKILFGSAAAICAVAGLSSFKIARSTTSYYWFQAKIQAPFTPLAGTNPTGVKNANLISYYTLATTQSVANPCSVSQTFDCLLGFTANQVVPTSTGSSIYKLITSVSISQATRENAFSKAN